MEKNKWLSAIDKMNSWEERNIKLVVEIVEDDGKYLNQDFIYISNFMKYIVDLVHDLPEDEKNKALEEIKEGLKDK